MRGIKPEIWTDEKFASVSPMARLLFIGMWNHACDNGHVEDSPLQLKMRIFPADDVQVADLLAELVDHGLVERVGRALKVPNLPKHQNINLYFLTLCAHCASDKASHYTEADRKQRGGKRDSSKALREQPSGATMPAQWQHSGDPVSKGAASTEGEGEGEGEGEITSSSEIADAIPDREDVTNLCEHLARRIVNNGGKKPTIGKTWKNAARLILDRDQRDPDEAHRLIDWCQSDPFWMSNILSMPKFREKYDQLRLRAGTTIQPEPAGRYEPRQPTPEQQARIDEARARHEQRLRDAETERANELPTTQAERDAAAAKLREVIGL